MSTKLALLSAAVLICSNNAYAVDTPVLTPEETPSSQTQIYDASLQAKFDYDQSLSKEISASSDSDLKEILRNSSVLDDPDAKSSTPPNINVKDKKKMKEFLDQKLGGNKDLTPQVPKLHSEF